MRWLAFVLLGWAGCATDGPGRIEADLPDRAAFAGPGKVLVSRCGTSDCHGSPYRNYRLKGDLALDYDATVSIEPERTRAIANGEEPTESSTLLRKAHGTEAHKGGVRLVPGSSADLCVVNWLRRSPDERACAAALPAP
jgi:hypothetical protein